MSEKKMTYIIWFQYVKSIFTSTHFAQICQGAQLGGIRQRFPSRDLYMWRHSTTSDRLTTTNRFHPLMNQHISGASCIACAHFFTPLHSVPCPSHRLPPADLHLWSVSKGRYRSGAGKHYSYIISINIHICHSFIVQLHGGQIALVCFHLTAQLPSTCVHLAAAILHPSECSVGIQNSASESSPEKLAPC